MTEFLETVHFSDFFVNCEIRRQNIIVFFLLSHLRLYFAFKYNYWATVEGSLVIRNLSVGDDISPVVWIIRVVSHRAREVSLKEVSPFLSVARVVGGPGDERPFRKSLPSGLGKYLKNKAWLHALCLEKNEELLWEFISRSKFCYQVEHVKQVKSSRQAMDCISFGSTYCRVLWTRQFGLSETSKRI